MHDTDPDIQAELTRLDRLAMLLDARFAIPGTGVRIGIDGMLGLVPGIGDAAPALASLYLVYRASRLRPPARVLVKMLFNVALDWAVGTVPIAGDVFDIAFKANRRNVALLRRYVESGH